MLSLVLACFMAAEPGVPATTEPPRSVRSLFSLAAADSAVPIEASERRLTLEEALRLAERANLTLAAASHRVDAARARARDASRWPNPSTSASVENAGGSLGTERAESSLQLEQLMELGGDRAARSGLARSLVDQTVADAEVSRRDVLRATAERFLEAWVQQERARRLAAAARSAAVAVEAASQRLRAGAAPEFERLRAEGFRAQREVERLRAEAELAVARRRLALQWAADSLAFDSLALGPPAAQRLPDLASLLARIQENPERQRAAAEVSGEEWRLREARAARVPDLSVAAGLRHLNEVGGTGFVAGVSVPLPLWNNRAGSVAAAESERSAAAARARGTEQRLRQEVRAAYDLYSGALAVWEGLRSNVKPAAEEALRQIVASYRAGRLSYLEIQDAQRNLIEADLLLIDGNADVWRTKNALELLVGVPLEQLSPRREDR
jgi:cobalt-zinc-cadmium efflux system outer membrane protein